MIILCKRVHLYLHDDFQLVTRRIATWGLKFKQPDGPSLSILAISSIQLQTSSHYNPFLPYHRTNKLRFISWTYQIQSDHHHYIYFFHKSHDQSIHPTWKRYDVKTWTPLLPDSAGSTGTPDTTGTPEAAAAASKGALQALREVLEEMQHHLEEEKLELGFFVSLGRNSWDIYIYILLSYPEISWNKYHQISISGGFRYLLPSGKLT